MMLKAQPVAKIERRTTSRPSAGPAERMRLAEDAAGAQRWKLWGPYLSERQWGTVREDYSPYGNAWEYFSHDQARSRAYRWGEDGIAGISDASQRLCLALALWNGKDPILKERLFGLTNGEGNHSEDVKELYYYLDATPTHSYLKFLYKYPQREFPYAWLVEENRRRGKDQPEFELIDTGTFDDDRYFDVFVEYAKAAPEDVLMRVTAHNRGPEAATIHLLPQVWFRNTWSWRENASRPEISVASDGSVSARLKRLGDYHLYAEGEPELLFTDNDSNQKRLFGVDGGAGHFKDAFHDYVIKGARAAVNSQRVGTKAAAHYRLEVDAGGSVQIRLRLRKGAMSSPLDDFETIFAQRMAEADEFFGELQDGNDDADA
ncbi:MAG TPA: hypothetical protein VLE23_03370, partial [Geminicoccaceae bacterium]|nr:hypothetical protein [Geminicoccaceae bacterium]